MSRLGVTQPVSMKPPKHKNGNRVHSPQRPPQNGAGAGAGDGPASSPQQKTARARPGRSRSSSNTSNSPESPNASSRASSIHSDHSASLYKTEPCKSFMESGYCRYGTKCRFAHGNADLRPVSRHKKYKTEKCKNYERMGSCPYGSRCRFIHGDVDPAASKTSTPMHTPVFGSISPAFGSKLAHTPSQRSPSLGPSLGARRPSQHSPSFGPIGTPKVASHSRVGQDFRYLGTGGDAISPHPLSLASSPRPIFSPSPTAPANYCSNEQHQSPRIQEHYFPSVSKLIVSLPGCEQLSDRPQTQTNAHNQLSSLFLDAPVQGASSAPVSTDLNQPSRSLSGMGRSILQANLALNLTPSRSIFGFAAPAPDKFDLRGDAEFPRPDSPNPPDAILSVALAGLSDSGELPSKEVEQDDFGQRERVYLNGTRMCLASSTVLVPPS